MSNERTILGGPLDTPRGRYLEHQEELRRRVERYIYEEHTDLAPVFEGLLSSGQFNWELFNTLLSKLVDDRDYWNRRVYELEDELAHSLNEHNRAHRRHLEEKQALAHELDLERARKGVGPYKYSRIAIIKAMRCKLAFGLKEAKDFLDFVSERVNEEDQRQGPWDFQAFRKVWNEKVCNNNPGSILFLGDE